MARFLISPGVITREIDQSQYAATTPGTGNIAALVGYAEKGPFDPVIVTSAQDFNQTFGYTIKNAPYLAQAAYKYFEERAQLLVVRAGDSRDPEAFPQAAQYASKTIRTSPEGQPATEGYQEFKATSDLQSGSFTAGATYSLDVQADFRAFKTPKYVETWKGLASETSNSAPGVPSPSQGIADTVFKAAMDSSTSTKFIANYKSDNVNGTATEEYYGENSGSSTTCERSILGSTPAYGDTIRATLFRYRRDNTYSSSNQHNSITGSYQAACYGGNDITSGIDFSGSPESMSIIYGSETYQITLDSATTTDAELVSAVNAALAVAVDEAGNGSVVDISSKFNAFMMNETTSKKVLAIKKTNSDYSSFTLTGDLLITLGINGQEYRDSETIVGTWRSEWDGSIDGGITQPTVFQGDFVFHLKSAESNMLSFEEAETMELTAPSSGNWTLTQIVSDLNAKLDVMYSDYSSPQSRGVAEIVNGKIRISAEGEASSNFASIVRISPPSSGGNSFVSLLGGVSAAVDGLAPGNIGESLITLRAQEKGTYGNNLMLRVETQNITYGSSTEQKHNVYVLLNGKEVSVYQKVNWTNPSASNYILSMMASDNYIKIESADEDEDDIHSKLPDGDWKLGDDTMPEDVYAADAEVVSFKVGTNGWTEEEGVITSMSADLANALSKINNSEVFEIDLVAAPGAGDPVVQNAIQSFCDSRRDCFGVIDAAPLGIGIDISAGNGVFSITDVNAACSTMTSSFVGAFWPWIQDYDSDNQQYLWLPPSIYALKQMIYTDNVSDPWYAPAGTTRGRITALDVEYSATRLDRDVLYGDTNVVNPIVKFVNEGITIWGQKTAQRTNSATNRINVRRLLIYAEKLIQRMARGFLFEPNDTANYAAFTRQANAILEPIRQRRGLQTYQVVCDETTNTPEIVAQNIMVGKIYVQPTNTIEFIEVEFTITGQGDVSFNEG